MKLVSIALFVVAALLYAARSQADPLRADHPLIGAWKLELPNLHCQETYRIRKEGTISVTSAEEVAESEFVISDKPSAKGFYKWVDKVVKDNGKKDCAGELTQIGHESTNYILLHPTGNMFLLCEKEDANTCVGPLVRQKGGDT